MTYMLDTNICIYAIKNKPPQVLQRLREIMGKSLCISAITLAELEHGGPDAVPGHLGCIAL